MRGALFFFLASILTYVVGAERPNILFIIADDASRDSFGAYGCKYIKTPGFDRIAREGVLFEQAYNCNPKCSPARACLLTGRYSWQLEESCNHNPYLGDHWQFYPFLLESEGYRVGYTGKGWGPGEWRGYGGPATQGLPNPAGYPWNDLKKKPPYAGISSTDYAANFEAFLAAETNSDQPFCFWLGTKEPHRGYGLNNWKLDGRDLSEVEVPDYYPDNETIRGDLADYAIEVEWFDQHIQGALQHLEDAGKLDNTIIIATSDHGMPFPRVK
ncbi:MAG: sulfatase-like hydrolase/transferase, partial [Verrucomicrobiota bacterium]